MIVNQYRLYCETEQDSVYIWDIVEPTVCPNNADHTILADSATVVNTVSDKHVTIVEENIPTGGHFAARTTCVNVDPITGKGSKTLSWHHPVTPLSITFVSEEIHRGDKLNLSIAKNTPISPLLGVSGNTIQLMAIPDILAVGFYISLSNGYDMGIVTAVNKVNNTITTSIPYSGDISGTVLMSIYIFKDYEIGPPQTHVIGQSKVGGRYVPANTPITIDYTCDPGVAKKMIGCVEYLY